MNIKKHITCIIAAVTLFAFTSSSVHADINLGNDDGTDFKGGTSNNYWGVYTDGGVPLNDTEGLRVTVYHAVTNDKAFNTIDITGNPNIAAASSLRYFSDGDELIPKTTWLSYVNGKYNSISESDMTKFNNAVTSRLNGGNGYRAEYIPGLADIDIVSVNNTENLEAIRTFLGKKEFLVHLVDLIGGGLTYEDIAQGKYKIAFEPVAYFRYNGQNWAMSATECGLLNKYMKNYFSTGWNSTNNLRALLGPLTHSNLPRSAFLENKDLGILVYSPSSSDYYNGNSSYNSDTCIIRCMGIGVLSAEEPPDDDKTKGGSTIKSGTVNVNCPENEEAMSWFQWHTPTRAQSVTITLKTSNSNLLLIGGGEVYLPEFLAMYNVRQGREYLIKTTQNQAPDLDSQMEQALGDIPETAEDAQEYINNSWGSMIDGRGAINLNLFQMSNLKSIIENLERMFEKGFFSGLQPFQQAVQAINDLARYSKDCELFILSATVDGEPPYCCDEKNQWLDRYCPEIDQAHRLFTKIGISKSEYIPGGIQSDDILWDDYNQNLEEWVANGGVAVKCKNNINHKGLIGPIWQGLIIANDASSELIRNSLSEIAYEAAESSDEEWEL